LKKRLDFKDIYGSGPNYARGVRAGNTLYISGTTAMRSDAQGGPAMAQLRVVLDRIVRMVKAEGGKPSDIVKLTTYVTNIGEWIPITDEQTKVYTDFFGKEFPTNAIIGIAGLGNPAVCVEIEAIAVLD